MFYYLMLHYFNVSLCDVALFWHWPVCCWFIYCYSFWHCTVLRWPYVMFHYLMLHVLMLHYFGIALIDVALLIVECSLHSCCTSCSCNSCCFTICPAWELSKYRVISGPYFPAFGLHTERYEVYLRLQSKWGKMRIRNNSVFGHFLQNVNVVLF